jgi:hypothetical protein
VFGGVGFGFSWRGICYYVWLGEVYGELDVDVVERELFG